MTQEVYNCTKCGGQMRRGFIADRSDNQAYFLANWIEGEPKKQEFLGLKLNNVDISSRAEFDVRSLRCDRCGFLELYAV